MVGNKFRTYSTERGNPKNKKNSANLDLQTDGLIRKSGYLVQSPPSGVVRLALTDVQYDRKAMF